MFYVAHRLFAAHDRALGALVAHQLALKSGPEKVFLPFCDTDEEELTAPVKGRRLFELDRERLRSLTAMIAVLHGPSLDDGVCMEIGCAAALGIPVIVLTTDFQTYSAHENGPRWEFPDPLIETVATRVVRAERLGAPPSAGTGSRFETFAARNCVQIDRAVGQAVAAALTAPSLAQTMPDRPVARGGTVFLEPSPYTPYPQALESAARGIATVITASRFTSLDPRTAAGSDWAQALQAETLVADVSGPEAPPGAAVLIGAGRALERKIAAFHPNPHFSHAPGREPNWRNLMIQYAADAHLHEPQALTAWLAS
ncbi:nucleoside 2-deoxyribosyltransferase [Streptomyces sp. NPDC001691]|uniref:nucleoside 2-deoxyribosyltransferase n=1 Tax=Streptomyces sp. NPDC001691 TaxID=3364600 RepID=UPI00369141A9